MMFSLKTGPDEFIRAIDRMLRHGGMFRQAVSTPGQSRAALSHNSMRVPKVARDDTPLKKM